MNNKVVLATAVIASILVVGMISPIGIAFAHVNVCSSSNDKDHDGTPFSALWAAVCDLQSQVDSLQNQINNLHGGGGSSSSYIQVSLNNTAPSTCPTLDSAPTTHYGWCNGGGDAKFVINDPRVNTQSVIVTSTVAPHGINEVLSCIVESTNWVDTVGGSPATGFLIKCDASPNPDTVLNYIIVNNPTSNTCTPPQVLQNGVCVTPPVICTPPQVLQNGVCVTPPVICTPPQVLQNGVCVTPPVICTPPQVLQNGVCVTPTTHDDDKDKKQGNDSQFSNYKNENRH